MDVFFFAVSSCWQHCCLGVIRHESSSHLKFHTDQTLHARGTTIFFFTLKCQCCLIPSDVPFAMLENCIVAWMKKGTTPNRAANFYPTSMPHGRTTLEKLNSFNKFLESTSWDPPDQIWNRCEYSWRSWAQYKATKKQVISCCQDRPFYIPIIIVIEMCSLGDSWQAHQFWSRMDRVCLRKHNVLFSWQIILVHHSCSPLSNFVQFSTKSELARWGAFTRGGCEEIMWHTFRFPPSFEIFRSWWGIVQN